MTINETLQMDISTATNQLKVRLMFDLAQRLGLTNCYKCHDDIETADDLSVDHRQPWRGVSAELFWDLDNIAFTHRRCNKTDRPGRIVSPEGKAWCGRCKMHKLKEEFGSDPKRWNGVAKTCLACCREQQKRYDEKNPRHSCPECGSAMRKTCRACGYNMPMKDYMALRRAEGVSY